jgi:hypothetical protein
MRTEKLEREAATKEEQFLLQILCWGIVKNQYT